MAKANLFLKGRNTVYIDSIGGNPRIANEIATRLMRNKSAVLVGRRCYSACAQFLVFVDDVTVLPWTQIGVHHNAVAFEELKADFDNAGHTFDWSSIQAVARRTRFNARLTKTDSALFTEAFDQLGIECHQKAVFTDQGTLAGFEYRSTFKFWVPTRDQIDGAREAPIKGWWPRNWFDVAISVSRNSAPSDRFKFAFGSKPQRTGSAKALVRPCASPPVGTDGT